MNRFHHIALIAAVSFFASCAKNEIVEPATPAAGSNAAGLNNDSQTTPLLDSDAAVQDPALETAPNLDSDTPVGTTVTETTPNLDADSGSGTPAVTTGTDGSDTRSARPRPTDAAVMGCTFPLLQDPVQ